MLVERSTRKWSGRLAMKAMSRATTIATIRITFRMGFPRFGGHALAKGARRSGGIAHPPGGAGGTAVPERFVPCPRKSHQRAAATPAASEQLLEPRVSGAADGQLLPILEDRDPAVLRV